MKLLGFALEVASFAIVAASIGFWLLPGGYFALLPLLLALVVKLWGRELRL